MVGFMDQRRNTNNHGIYGSRWAEIPRLVALCLCLTIPEVGKDTVFPTYIQRKPVF